MLLEILKIVLPFISGGLAGAVLNEWLRRRHGKIQPIPLIERVNRLVSPEMKGFTLARVTGGPENPQLEEIKNVREYQLTLRNTSSVHLQDVEIQFEFPTEDVEAWAERPALSKTAPVRMDAVITEPWKKGYRWRIPQLPATDSIEFTFRAVDPISDTYEVALYKSDRVVIQKSKGEPSVKKGLSTEKYAATAAVMGILASLVAVIPTVLFNSTANNAAMVQQDGCAVTVVSSFARIPASGWPWEGPWQITHRVTNQGPQKCAVQSDQLIGQTKAVQPGEELTGRGFSTSKPKLIDYDLFITRDGPMHTLQVKAYGQPK